MVDSSVSPRWHIAGALATWLVPGLGHWLLGQHKRGLILLTSIGLLWLGGFFIGGVSVFDRKEHPIWYIGQMLVAPSILAEKWHHSLQDAQGQPAFPDDDAIPYEPSYGHIHEQGVLYTSLAGMLNLLAIMDVLYQDPKAGRHKPEHAPQTPNTAAANGGGGTA